MIAAVLLCVCSLMGLAQKNDYIWYGGYGSDMVIDSVQFGYRFGQSKLDFRSGPMQVSYDSLGMNFTFTSNSYALNNKSFKTGPEVEPAFISNKIPRESVSWISA